jgi:glycosyltransferase involved in cell wall biosynthesis
MRILQLIYEAPGSPFGFGGAGVRAREIYRRLRKKHEITLVSMRYPGAQDSEEQGLRQIYVGAESKNLSLSVLSYTLQAARYVRRHGREFDVVVENFLPSMPFFSRFLTQTPSVLQVQGILEGHARKKFSALHAVPMAAVESFYPGLHGCFIFVSEVTREKVLSGLRNQDVFAPVVPNGIDRSLLDTVPEEDNYLLFLSRIDVYTKGLDLLLKVFAGIGDAYPGLELVLAGYEFDSVNGLLASLPEEVRKRVWYAGFATGEEKVRLLRRAKIFILPSRHESGPVSILEAAACAKPVLVSDIPELGFVAEHGFGRSFRSGSAEDLAEELTTLLDQPADRARMGEAGRAYARRFLWDDIAVGFEEALRRVIELAR